MAYVFAPYIPLQVTTITLVRPGASIENYNINRIHCLTETKEVGSIVTSARNHKGKKESMGMIIAMPDPSWATVLWSGGW